MNKTTNEAVKQNETTLADVKTVEVKDLKNVIGGMAQGWSGGVDRGALSIGHQMRN